MNKKIGIGLSQSSVLLLEKLKARHHIQEIFLPPKLSTVLKKRHENFFFESLSEAFKANWGKGNLFLVVGALGAVTRLIAPFLKNKEEDPAVLVLDAQGSKVIPLVGSHFAGGEKLAIQIAEELGGIAVITGDSRNSGKLDLDSYGRDWGWRRSGEMLDWSKVMHSQAHNSNLNVLQNSGSEIWRESNASKNLNVNDLQNIGNSYDYDFIISPYKSNKCCWHPSTLWIGIGCEKGTSFSLIKRSILEVLQKSDLSEIAVAGIATIDIKNTEKALIQLSRENNWPIRSYKAQELKCVDVPNPSERVEKEVGCCSVSEASALLASGIEGKLLEEKNIFYSNDFESGAVTISIAQSKKSFFPKNGELHLVGAGPGDISYLTGDARMALARTPLWIGYSRYLNLINSLKRDDQVRIDWELTFEKERCIQALDFASQGIKVSLVSSGDSGIYGMAALALELLLKIPKEEQPKLFIHPGISAVQLAASRIGAPLSNDFCIISLSDRLTPWIDIKKRIIGAAKGDFVVAFYNPKSKDRDWQLRAAIDLLLEYREPNVPVVFAKQVGRVDERIAIHCLEESPLEEVDMLTIVIVGNSHSKIDGQYFLTPRGYLN